MTYEELLEMCVLTVVTPQKLASCEPFCCDNQDLDEFFANDSVIYSKRLLGKTYLLCLRDNPNIVVAAFTLSNDSIRITNKLNDESKKSFLDFTDLQGKRLRRFPAVLIGRLATNKKFAGKGIGTAVMDLIKTGSDIITKPDAVSLLLMPIIVILPFTIIKRTVLNILLKMNVSKLNTWK